MNGDQKKGLLFFDGKMYKVILMNVDSSTFDLKVLRSEDDDQWDDVYRSMGQALFTYDPSKNYEHEIDIDYEEYYN